MLNILIIKSAKRTTDNLSITTCVRLSRPFHGLLSYATHPTDESEIIYLTESAAVNNVDRNAAGVYQPPAQGCARLGALPWVTEHEF